MTMRVFWTILCLTAILAAQPLPVASPEKEGISGERLGRLHAKFEEFVKEGKRAGAITLVMRNGKVVDWKTYGYRDLEARLPMEKDTICRIWSMTKVVTSVAVMMLVEEGKLALADPVSKLIPEFKEMRVLTGGLADRPETVAAARPVTVKHLLTHTSGLTYTWGNDTVSELYRRAKIFEGANLKEFVGRVAKLPLIAHPGEKYNYGINIDVLGYLVEVVSGMPFEQFVQTRIANPLQMKDTHFVLPKEKLPRLAKTYEFKDGVLVEAKFDAVRWNENIPYGGMGLYSTIGDYARFGQMLLNCGELNGVRLLGRKTVELMTVNHLNDLKTPSIDTIGAYGFGLGGSVHLDIAKGRIPGSVGDFGWDGAASTYFRMDPKEKLVALLFQQYMPFDKPNLELFSTLVNQAIVD
jgi:CubicO group peptidase (beta-lactamase class C family)